MPNTVISQITLPSGTTYDIKDAYAREQLATIAGLDAINFKGVSTTALTDGGTQNPTVNGNEVTTKTTGDLYFYGSAEFIWDGAKWIELGDLTNLGDLARHNVGDLAISVSGTAAAQVFTGTEATLQHSVTQGSVSASGSYTPSGSVAIATNSQETVVSAVNPTSATYKVGDDDGSVTAGSAASFTQGTDTFTATVSNEILTLNFTQGTDNFTANTPTAVTLPTFQNQTLVSDVQATSGAVDIPATFSFSGTQATVEVEGSTSGVAVADITYTPAGTNGTSTVSATGSASYSA